MTCFLIATESLSAQCHPDDYKALKALYEATDGDNWNNNTGWDVSNDDPPSGCDVSGWFGVTLNSASRVSSLRLPNNGLSGPIPPELGNLSSLEWLFLYNNSLTSVPVELGNLSSLEQLYLYYNSLTSVPSELGNLSSLRTLLLHNNSLTSVPVELGNLSSLEQLNFNNNSLTSVPVELGNLSSLRVLHLGNNSLTSVPVELGNLSSLEELDLYNNSLTSVPVELGNLSSLEVLILSNNSLTSVPSELGNLSSLMGLYLYNNSISCYPSEFENFCEGVTVNSTGNDGLPTWTEFCDTEAGTCVDCTDTTPPQFINDDIEDCIDVTGLDPIECVATRTISFNNNYVDLVSDPESGITGMRVSIGLNPGTDEPEGNGVVIQPSDWVDLDEDVVITYQEGLTFLDISFINECGLVTSISELCDGYGRRVDFRDGENPTPICKAVSHDITNSGSVTVTSEDLNNGSFDNCTPEEDLIFHIRRDGEVNYSTSLDFDCDDVGSNDVWMIVGDRSTQTNWDSCMTTVTINEFIPPRLTCVNIDLQLNENGYAEIGSEVTSDRGDDCSGLKSIFFSQAEFTCADVGVVEVELTATDHAGNTTSCISEVSVLPSISCVSCEDGIQNGDEEGVDCGGATCDPCAVCPEVFLNNFSCSQVWPLPQGSCERVVVIDFGTSYEAALNADSIGIIEWKVETAPLLGDASVVTDDVVIDKEGWVSVEEDITVTYPVGLSYINLSFRNDCGDEASTVEIAECNGGISVDIRDNVDPLAICNQNINVPIQNGIGILTATQVDNGSTDNCTPQDQLIRKIKRLSDPDSAFRDQLSFGCDEIGMVEVELIIYDLSTDTNSARCTTDVLIVNDGSCETCTDGIQNGDEEDIDCGGSCPNSCQPNAPTGFRFTNGDILDNGCNNGVSNELTIDLTWDAVADADQYDVSLYVSFNGETNPLVSDQVTDNSFSWLCPSDPCFAPEDVIIQAQIQVLVNGYWSAPITIQSQGFEPVNTDCPLDLDSDDDGYTIADGDCNDFDPDINPDATEICGNDIDENCDGDIDACPPMDTDNDGYTTAEGDCDDQDAFIYPGAPEICDGVDNDCDGIKDNGVQTTYYRDRDGDSYGDDHSIIASCSLPYGYVTRGGDCNDWSNSVYPGAPERCDDGIDQDCDGSDLSCLDVDDDGDGYTENQGDCDDTTVDISPGVEEVCDGIDNNCDGRIDEGVRIQYYTDWDGDGYGARYRITWLCPGETSPYATTDRSDCDDDDPTVYPGAPEICADGKVNDCSNVDGEDGECIGPDNDDDGFTTDGGDCDDNDPNTYPGAPESCDGIDNDCDGKIDENAQLRLFADVDGDGYGNPDHIIFACSVSAGVVRNNKDCDDTNADVYPGAEEICGDGIANDCSGGADEECIIYDMDGDGYTEEDGDCDDTDASIHPGAVDICGDDIDSNCDGNNDPPLTIYYTDWDGDGYGSRYRQVRACSQPWHAVTNRLDCDDDDATVYPGAPEICADGKVNDCSNVDGEDGVCVGPDNDGDGFTTDGGDCDDSDPNTYPGAKEICDGKDNDCDGKIDENAQRRLFADVDGDGYGNPDSVIYACNVSVGVVRNNKDCDDTNAEVYPGAEEICGDGIANDCSGGEDEECIDYDMDDDGYTEEDGDCDDMDPSIHPGAEEICGDDIDSNCDGIMDPPLTIYYTDWDGDGYGSRYRQVRACSQPWHAVTNRLDCDDDDATIYPGAPEICGDGIDQDCNRSDMECAAANSASNQRTASSVISVAEASDLSIEMFPNPTTGRITLDFEINEALPLQFDVMDITGRSNKVINYVTDKGHNRVEIDLSGMNSGVYFIHTRGTSSRIPAQRVIKID